MSLKYVSIRNINRTEHIVNTLKDYKNSIYLHVGEYGKTPLIKTVWFYEFCDVLLNTYQYAECTFSGVSSYEYAECQINLPVNVYEYAECQINLPS
jgi:hypothetical protein